jgi:hypothetical protein
MTSEDVTPLPHIWHYIFYFCRITERRANGRKSFDKKDPAAARRTLCHSGCNKDSLVEQPAHFFGSLFLKISFDQLSQNMYTSINNHQSFFMKFVYSNPQSTIINEMGDGAYISSFLREKAWRQKETYVN